MTTIWRYLPRGNTLDEVAWQRRHHVVLAVLALHLPALFIFGLVLGHSLMFASVLTLVPTLCAALGYLIKNRAVASALVSTGLIACSVALVIFSRGTIEAHFHFFIIVGFIALYQDWVPFAANILLTVLTHGLGSALIPTLMFNHHAAQHSPWVWSAIHGVSVALACIGVVLFWRISEDDQLRVSMAKRKADVEAERRRFTSDLLVNLARRNQKMLYRQLEIINQLEHKESDPDALAELFKLEHLATRVRRNAENLLVLSGEPASRVWSTPVPLREVVQAAIAETEDLERVTFQVDERLAVAGNCVADLTHLLAELAENAVRFSPPGSKVKIAQRPYPRSPGAQLIIIEDFGVGMPPEAVEAANELLRNAPEVDLSESRQLGFHVVARLARRHGISVSLTPTPGCGVTAAVVLPAELFGPRNEALPGHGGDERHAPQPALAGAGESLGSWSQPTTAPASMDPTATNGVSATTTMPAVGGWPAEANGHRDGNGHQNGWWNAETNGHAAGSNGHAPGTNGHAAGSNGHVPGTNGHAADTEPDSVSESVPSPARDEHMPQEQTPQERVAQEQGLPQREMGEGNAASTPKLRRRRPQTHLAPELRHPVPYPRNERGAQPRGGPDGRRDLPPRTSPDALSRYQASRHAARAVAEGRDDQKEQTQ